MSLNQIIAEGDCDVNRKRHCSVYKKSATRFCYDGAYKAGEKKCKWFCEACSPHNTGDGKRSF